MFMEFLEFLVKAAAKVLALYFLTTIINTYIKCKYGKNIPDDDDGTGMYSKDDRKYDAHDRFR